MAKFNVGDRVRIKPDAEYMKELGGVGLEDVLAFAKDTVFTIDDADYSSTHRISITAKGLKKFRKSNPIPFVFTETDGRLSLNQTFSPVDLIHEEHKPLPEVDLEKSRDMLAKIFMG